MNIKKKYLLGLIWFEISPFISPYGYVLNVGIITNPYDLSLSLIYDHANLPQEWNVSV